MASLVHKTRSWVSLVLSDPGNYPLLAANLAGCGVLAFFGGRKLLHHPDVRPSISERSIADTTPATLENGHTFRAGTALFSAPLSWMADKYHAITFLGGRPRDNNFWTVAGYSERVPAPLEHTNYFEDGLFKATPPSPAPTGVFHAADDKE